MIDNWNRRKGSKANRIHLVDLFEQDLDIDKANEFLIVSMYSTEFAYPEQVDDDSHNSFEAIDPDFHSTDDTNNIDGITPLGNAYEEERSILFTNCVTVTEESKDERSIRDTNIMEYLQTQTINQT